MLGSFIKTIAFIGLIIALGCEASNSLSSDPDFGDAYSITRDGSNATPRLDADGLHVTVQYSGGCKAHVFDVHFRTTGNTTEVWLQHDANGDACEAFLTETLQRTVSTRILETPNVVLLTPDGSSFPLR